jgi:predicted peptidase
MLAAGGCKTPVAHDVRPGRQVIQSFAQTQERELETHYLLFLPEAYGRDDERAWPLIVYLHGGGGRGTDPERLRLYPMVKRLDEEPDFPFVVVTPQCPPGRGGPLGDLWTEHADLVLAILDKVLADYRIDPDRVYLMGHSMGGYGTWYLAHRAPERFAAIAPMSGPGVTWWAYRIADARIPVWVFHGALDDAVPVAESEQMVKTLRDLEGDVRFTRYSDKGHVYFEPFEGDELFDWFLSHPRAGS